jgi:two-component system, OmpR family, sensor histidine kinase KdpD
MRHELARRVRLWRAALRRQIAPLRARYRSDPTARYLVEYGAAVLATALATAAIGIAQAHVQTRGLSLVYLLVVLWLASVFGRGPAILASVLAFFAYDYFFIPPLHRLTVNDPTEWINLFALLATALVLGQLTASVQARARDARESQQRTALLYGLSQLVASTTDAETLIAALAGRVVQVFAPAGVAACTLVLPDEQRQLVARAAASTGTDVRPLVEALSLEHGEQRGLAAWALEHGSPAGGHVATADARTDATSLCFFVPLRSRGRVIGVLGIGGREEIRRLVKRTPHGRGLPTTGAEARAGTDPQAELFDAFCEHIALALDRAQLQQEAIHAEALRESDRLKNALLGSVTHDLRTPVAAIQAAVGALRDPDVARSEMDRRDLLDAVDASANRLNRLVSNLLDLSRLEAGVAAPVKEWYLIGDAVATVLDRLDLAGQLAGRTVRVEIPGDIPLVPMDHAQIEQVLTNVVENALKYSPVDTPVRVSASVDEETHELVVRVADHGVGIPPGELHAVFDKFYRVQQVPLTGTRTPAGTGLGLAICANIIQAHGGRIWAESQLGAGTTIVWTLPIPADGPRGGLPELEPGVEAAGSADRVETEAGL